MSEQIHKDFLKRDLQIDDYVVFPAPYGQGLKLGKIIKFTPKNMRVQWSRKGYRGDVSTEETIRTVKECVKVEGPELTMFLLSGEY